MAIAKFTVGTVSSSNSFGQIRLGVPIHTYDINILRLKFGKEGVLTKVDVLNIFLNRNRNRNLTSWLEVGWLLVGMFIITIPSISVEVCNDQTTTKIVLTFTLLGDLKN